MVLPDLESKMPYFEKSDIASSRSFDPDPRDPVSYMLVNSSLRLKHLISLHGLCSFCMGATRLVDG